MEPKLASSTRLFEQPPRYVSCRARVETHEKPTVPVGYKVEEQEYLSYLRFSAIPIRRHVSLQRLLWNHHYRLFLFDHHQPRFRLAGLAHISSLGITDRNERIVACSAKPCRYRRRLLDFTARRLKLLVWKFHHDMGAGALLGVEPQFEWLGEFEGCAIVVGTIATDEDCHSGRQLIRLIGESLLWKGAGRHSW